MVIWQRAGVAKQPDRIRVGVVGLGYFGSHHARHYAANAGADLVAVVDVDPERGCAATERYGCASHADHRALIGKVDAVSITVPTSNHHEVASNFLDAGIDVFVEKPITADAASAADLVDRAEKANAILQVGHIERFSPAFHALRERSVDPRLISAVRRTEWRGRATDVDVVLDLMIHDIDLVLALAGAPVVSVEAIGAPVVSATNDIAEARLVFANGVTATLAASRVAPKGERTLAVAEPGRYLVADFAAPSLSLIARGGEAAVRTEAVPLVPSDNLAAEIGGFLDCVANRQGAPGRWSRRPCCAHRRGEDSRSHPRPGKQDGAFDPMIASRAAMALVLAPDTRIALFDLQRQRARLDTELRARMDAVLAHGQFILGPGGRASSRSALPLTPAPSMRLPFRAAVTR